MYRLLVPLLVATAQAAPTCPIREAHSGPQQVPLVELYTSEGCSSCPPADHWVSNLVASHLAPQRVVPLAFHVDYWDYIGWRDRFADARWSQRQERRASQTGQRTVFTPQILLDGRDASGDTAGPKLQRFLASAPAAPVDIRLQSQSDGGGVTVALQVAPRGAVRPGKVYLALYENGLSSQVKAGENNGATLRHDGVVRALLGPWPLDSSGKLDQHAQIPLAKGQHIEESGVAAWVEGADGQVWQTLALACAP